MFPAIHGIVSQRLGTEDGGGGVDGIPGILDPGTLTTVAGNALHLLGWEFQVGEAPITVIGGRVLADAEEPAQNVTMLLYRVSDGSLLATSSAFPLIPGDWAEVEFDSPIALSAGANYVIVARRMSSSVNVPENNGAVAETAAFSEHITYVRGRIRFSTTSTAMPSIQQVNIMRGIPDILFTVD